MPGAPRGAKWGTSVDRKAIIRLLLLNLPGISHRKLRFSQNLCRTTDSRISNSSVRKPSNNPSLMPEQVDSPIYPAPLAFEEARH